MEKLTPPFVFQSDSNSVKFVYDNENNYLVDESANSCQEQYCCIYFSSNDIYFPNTEKAFKKRIVERNSFEWYGSRIKKCKKHIFLRDIKKQWYLTGINKNLNTIEKLTSFIKEETEGYRIITVGSSAGGYAAVLFGSLLNAEYTLSFNGQFFLNHILHNSSERMNPIIFREQYNASVNKYYDLKTFIKDPQRIFYFLSKGSKEDNLQFEHIKDMGARMIGFRTTHHGIPFLKSNLKNVINLSPKEINVLCKKSHFPLLFSMKIEGLFQTMNSLLNQTILFLRKRYLP